MVRSREGEVSMGEGIQDVATGDGGSVTTQRNRVPDTPSSPPNLGQGPLPQLCSSSCSLSSSWEELPCLNDCNSGALPFGVETFSCYTLLSRTRALGPLSEDSKFLIIEGASRILKAYRRALSEIAQRQRCRVCGKWGESASCSSSQPRHSGATGASGGDDPHQHAPPSCDRIPLQGCDLPPSHRRPPEGPPGSVRILPHRLLRGAGLSGVRMMAEAHVSFCLSRLLVSSITSCSPQGSNSLFSCSGPLAIRSGLSGEVREAEGDTPCSLSLQGRGEAEASVPLLEGSWESQGTMVWARRLSRWPSEWGSNDVNIEELTEHQQPPCNTAVSSPEERLLLLHPFPEASDLQNLLSLFEGRERQLRGLLHQTRGHRHHKGGSEGLSTRGRRSSKAQQGGDASQGSAAGEDPVAASLEWLSPQPLQLPLHPSGASSTPFGAPTADCCNMGETASASAGAANAGWGVAALEDTLAGPPGGCGASLQAMALPRALHPLRLRLCGFLATAASLDCASYEEADEGSKGLPETGNSLVDEVEDPPPSFASFWGETHGPETVEEETLVDLWQRRLTEAPDLGFQGLSDVWRGDLLPLQPAKLLKVTRKRLLASLPPAFGGRSRRAGDLKNAADADDGSSSYLRGSSANRETRRILRAALEAARVELSRIRDRRLGDEGRGIPAEEREAEEIVARSLDCNLLLALHGGTLTCLVEFLETLMEAVADTTLAYRMPPGASSNLKDGLPPADSRSSSSSSSSSKLHHEPQQQQQQQQHLGELRRFSFPSVDALELLALQQRCSFSAALESSKIYVVGCRRRPRYPVQGPESVLSSALGTSGASITQLHVMLPEAATSWLSGASRPGGPAGGWAAPEGADGGQCVLLEFLYGNERLIRLRKEASSTLGTSAGSSDEASLLLYMEISSTALAVWTREPGGPDSGGDGRKKTRMDIPEEGAANKALVALFDLRGVRRLTIDVLVDKGGWQRSLAEASEAMEESALSHRSTPNRGALLDAVMNQMQQPREELVLFLNGNCLCCVPLPPSPPVAPALQGRNKQVLLRARVNGGAALISPVSPSFHPSVIEELRARALLSGLPKEHQQKTMDDPKDTRGSGDMSLREFFLLCTEAVHRLCLGGSKEGALNSLKFPTRNLPSDRSNASEEPLSAPHRVVASGDLQAVDGAVRLLEKQQQLWQHLESRRRVAQQQQQQQQQRQGLADSRLDEETSEACRSLSSGGYGGASLGCFSPAISSTTSSTMILDPLVSSERLSSTSSRSCSLGGLPPSSGSPGLRPVRLHLPRRLTEGEGGGPAAAAASAGPAAAAGEQQTPPASVGESVLTWEGLRTQAIESLRDWRISSERVYCILDILSLLLSSRHPFSNTKTHLLGPLGPRLMDSLLYLFTTRPPEALPCRCCRCQRQIEADQELVQAVFDAQGASWLLRKGVTDILSSVTPPVLRLLLGSARPQTLQLLLLNISQSRPPEDDFSGRLLHLFESSKTGRIIVVRLLNETRVTTPSRGEDIQNQKSKGEPLRRRSELLPGSSFALEDPAVVVRGPQLGHLPRQQHTEGVAALRDFDASKTSLDERSGALRQLGIRPCGLRAVGAAGPSFSLLERSDLDVAGGPARRKRRWGLPKHRQKGPEQKETSNSLRGACDRLASQAGSGFWPFLSCLLEITEAQLKETAGGPRRISASPSDAAGGPPKNSICVQAPPVAAGSPRGHPCNVWGPCVSSGPCGGGPLSLHSAPGLTLGVLANPRLVGLPIGAATGGEGCVCSQMHRPALWVPLHHRLQQMDGTLARNEGFDWASLGSHGGLLGPPIPPTLKGSSTGAGDVAAHVARHAAEVWLWRLFRRLRQRRMPASESDSKKQKEERRASLGTTETPEGGAQAPQAPQGPVVSSRTHQGPRDAGGTAAASDRQGNDGLGKEEYIFGGSLLLARGETHKRSTADTCLCLETLMAAVLRTANNLMSFLIDKILVGGGLSVGPGAPVSVSGRGGESPPGEEVTASEETAKETQEGTAPEGCRACSQQGHRLLAPLMSQRSSLLHGCSFVSSGVLPLLSFLTTLLQRLVSLGEEPRSGRGSGSGNSSGSGSKPGRQQHQSLRLSEGSADCVSGIMGLLFRLWPSILQLALRSLVLMRQLGTCVSEDPGRGSLHPLVEECLGIVTMTTNLLQCIGGLPPLMARLELSCCGSSDGGQQQAEEAATQALKSLPPLLVGGARYIAARPAHPFAAVEEGLRSSVLLLLDCSSRSLGGLRVNELSLPCGIDDFLAATQPRQGALALGTDDPQRPPVGSRATWHGGAPAASAVMSGNEMTAAEIGEESSEASSDVLLAVPSASGKAPGSCPPLLTQRPVPFVETQEVPAAAAHAAHAAASAAVACGSCCPSLLRLLYGESVEKEFGAAFNPFYPRLAQAQRAIGAALLHLLGFQAPTSKDSTGGSPQKMQEEAEEAEALIRLAASLARRAAVQLLSKWQRRTAEEGPLGDDESPTPLPLSDSEDSCLGGPSSCLNSTSPQKAKQQRHANRDEEVRAISDRCEWILLSCPRGLAGPKSLMLFSRWSRLIVGSHRLGLGGREEGLYRTFSCPELGGGMTAASRPVAWGNRRQSRRGMCPSLRQQPPERHTDVSGTPRLMPNISARQTVVRDSMASSSLSAARSLNVLKRVIRHGHRLSRGKGRSWNWGPPIRSGSEEKRHEGQPKRGLRSRAGCGLVTLPIEGKKTRDGRRSPLNPLQQMPCLINNRKGGDVMMDGSSSLASLINFILNGAEVAMIRRVLRVEQLAAVTRFVTLRSMKALLLAGLCSTNASGRPYECGSSGRRRCQEDFSSGSVTQRLITQDDRKPEYSTVDFVDEGDAFLSSPRLCSITEGIPVADAEMQPLHTRTNRRQDPGFDAAGSRKTSGALPSGPSGPLISLGALQQGLSLSDGGCLSDATVRGMEPESSDVSRRDASCVTGSSDGGGTCQLIDRSSRQEARWPLLLNLLLPSMGGRTGGFPGNPTLGAPPSGTAKRYGGWLLLRMLHSLGISMLGAKPAFIGALKADDKAGENEGTGDSSGTGRRGLAFWKTQPLADALQASLSEIVSAAFECHLHRSLPAMASLVQPPAPDIFVAHPSDICWMDALLRLLTLHICLNTEPLDESDAVVAFLQHLLTLSHPVPLRLGGRDRQHLSRNAADIFVPRGDGEEAFASDCRRGASGETWATAATPAVGLLRNAGPHRSLRSLLPSASHDRLLTGGPPQVSYVPLAAALTQVLIRCFDARRWISDGVLIQRGFRLHEKMTVAGCTVMVYVQRRQMAEPFTPPLKAIRDLEVAVDGGDEIIGPLRDSRTGPGSLTFSLSGPAAGEPDGMEEAITDVCLQVQAVGDLREREGASRNERASLLQRQGFSMEKQFLITADIKAHLWVKRGLLVYEAPITDRELPENKTDPRLRSSQRGDSGSCVLPLRQSLSMGSRPRLPSATQGMEGPVCHGDLQYRQVEGAGGDPDGKAQALVARRYEGASKRLQQSAWNAFQAALWFLLVSPEDGGSLKKTNPNKEETEATKATPFSFSIEEAKPDGNDDPCVKASESPQGQLRREAIALKALKMTLCILQRLVELQEQTIRGLQRNNSLGIRSLPEGLGSCGHWCWRQPRRGPDGWVDTAEVGSDIGGPSRGMSRASSLSEGEGLGGDEETDKPAGHQIPEKVLLTERLIERILVILLRCAHESEAAAGLLIKTLIASYRALPSQLETVLRSLPVKTCLYKLLTESVKRIPKTRGGGPSVSGLLPGGPRDFWEPPRSFSKEAADEGCRLFPPLQPISMGGLMESAGSLVQRHIGPVEPSSQQQEQQEAAGASPSLGVQGGGGSALPGRSGIESNLPTGEAAAPSLQYEGPEQGNGAGGPSAPSSGASDTPSAPVGISQEDPTDSVFASLPQSDVFLCAQASADFEGEVHGRTLHVMRARNLGGVALCRAPLTFPALHVEPGEAADVIGFRVWTAGRFGVTVAPADCVLSIAQDIFDRNDVVGFRTSSCPPFWEDVFATNVAYQPGDYLSVKFTVDDQPNGQRCLHTELHVSGESIGSVLEVFFDQASQIDQARRMNLVFVFQDPLTVVYGGPDFSLQYIDPDAARLTVPHPAAEGIVGDTGDDPQPLAQQGKRGHRLHPLFQQSLLMYQAILLAPEETLMGERRRVLERLCGYMKSAAFNLGHAFEALCSRYAEYAGQKKDDQAGERRDRAGSSANTKRSGIHSFALCAAALDSKKPESTDTAHAKETGAEARRDSSTGLRPCPFRPQQRVSKEEHETIRACRRGIAALAVIGCDRNGKGELQDVLEMAERPKGPGVVDPEAIHPSSTDINKGDIAGASGGPQGDMGYWLPWLVGTSSLSLSAVAGLGWNECENLVMALTDLITSPVIQGTLHQVAVVGHLLAPSKDWEVLQAIAVTLGSKSIVALCLVLRAMLQLNRAGQPPLSEAAQRGIERVFCFLEQFCFLTSGLEPRQIDPFAGDLQSLDGAAPGAPIGLLTKPSPAQSLASSSSKGLAYRSASVPDLRWSIAPYSSGTEGISAGLNASGCEPQSPSPAGAAASTASPEDDLRLDVMARLCGVPESILATEGLECPVVAGQAVLAASETPKVWRWIFKVNEAWHEAVRSSLVTETENVVGASPLQKEIYKDGGGSLDGREMALEELMGSGADIPAASLIMVKPRQDEGYIHFRGPVDVRVFNYEGTCSAWPRRMAHRLVETPLRWALRRDALHLVCTVAALCPYLLIDRLHRGIKESLKIRPSGDFRRGAPLPGALNLIRLFRICAYFVSRETDDNMPDYQQPFRLHLDTDPTEELLRQVDGYSVVADPLYGWQRVFYRAAATWTDPDCLERLHRLLQTELLYHLIGSVGQVVSNMRRSKKSPKYCALAPSVYVAHWLMDAFIRHPLCPGSIRRAIVYPLSYSSLFGLLINGSNLPLKLGLDAARMTHWILGKFVPDPSGGMGSVGEGLWQLRKGLHLSSKGNEAVVGASGVSTDDGSSSQVCCQGGPLAKAEAGGVAVRGPGRQFLGFLQCYLDCICFVGASVFDNLERGNSWRASTLDCFSGADLSRPHVRYRINCSLLVHYLATACVAILKADQWGSLTWLGISSVPVLSDLVSYLMAAESVAAASCVSTWAASAGAVTPNASADGRPQETATELVRSSVGGEEVAGSSESRCPAPGGDGSYQARVAFSPAFIRGVQTLPVPVSFSEPISCTCSVGRVESLPGVHLQLDLEPINSRGHLELQDEPSRFIKEGRELRKTPRLLVALDRRMKHLVGESSNSPQVNEWQHIFINSTRTGKDELHMEAQRLPQQTNSPAQRSRLVISNLHEPTLGPSFACSRHSLQCGASSASCSITFAVHSTAGDITSDFGLNSDGAPLGRIFLGAVDATHRGEVLEGTWDGVSHGSFIQLATRQLATGFAQGLPGRQWATHSQRSAKSRVLLTNLLGEGGVVDGGPASDVGSVVFNGLTFVLSAVGRHLLWFAGGQIVAAQMLPPSCTEVLPVVVIGEAPEACASLGVSALWRNLIVTATLAPMGRQPVSVPSNEVFYCLEPAPADSPVRLLRLSGGSFAKSEALGASGCQSYALEVSGDGRAAAEEQGECGNGLARPPIFLESFYGHYSLSDPPASGVSLGPRWRFFTLSLKIRSGVSARLPLGTPSVYSSSAWRWVRRPCSSQVPSEQGLLENQHEDAEADVNVARAVASTGHCSSDHSGFVGGSDSRQVSAGTMLGDPSSGGGSPVFMMPTYNPPTPGTGGGPSGAVTRAVLSPASLLGPRRSRTPAAAPAHAASFPRSSQREHSRPSESLWASPEAVASLGHVHPALPFRVQFRAGSRVGGDAGACVVGLVWGCCRWLWFSNGRLVCPLDLPVAELMHQQAEASSSSAGSGSGMRGGSEGWREVQVTRGVTGFNARDIVEIEFQPAIPALLFKKNDVYQFGFNFDKFYQWTPGHSTRTQQQQTPSAMVPERERDLNLFTPHRFRSTELISTGNTAISKTTAPPVAASLGTPRHVETHQGAVQALFVAIKDRNLRWLSNFFLYYPDWLEEQDAAATPGSCTFATLEQRLSGVAQGQQQQHVSLFGDHENDTPLKLAVAKGHADVVQMLIEEAGCNPDGVGDGSERITPLMLAAELGHDTIVAILVCNYGLNVNRRDADGNSALHRVALRAAGHPVTGMRLSSSLAQRRGYYSTVSLLLSLGADCTLKNDAGLTPVDIMSSRGEGALEGADAIARLLRNHAVTAQMQHQPPSTRSVPLTTRNLSASVGGSGCVASKWGPLLAGCSVIVGASGDANPTLHGVYIDGERRDEPQHYKERTALSSRLPADGLAELEAVAPLSVSPLQQQQQQQPTSGWPMDTYSEDWQVQSEVKKLSELKSVSPPFTRNVEDSAEVSPGGIGARTNKCFATIIESIPAPAEFHRWLAAASAAEAAEAGASWPKASASGSNGPTPLSLLRPGGCHPPVASIDLRTLLQQLLVSGLDLYGDGDPLSRADGQPSPIRPPMPAVSGALLRSVTWADDFHSLQKVLVTIIRRLGALEEQQGSQAAQSPGQQQVQHNPSPQGSRTIPSVTTRKTDGGRAKHHKEGQTPASLAPLGSSLQRLAVCAETAETLEDLASLLLPLESLAVRVEGSTRRGWLDGVQRQAWRQRVARDLGYEVALGGPGGLVWTPDVQLLTDATGCELQHPPAMPEEQGWIGQGIGMLVVRSVVDSDDLILQFVLRSWPLKLDIWLRQLLDFFEGPEENRSITQSEKHLRIIALVWKADGSREELLSFYRQCGLPIGKHDALEEVEQAAALKEAVIGLINEVSPEVVPRTSVELLSQQILSVRLRLLEHLSACATRAVPLVAPIFNIPKLPLDYYGLLTAYPGSCFFQGTSLYLRRDGGLVDSDVFKKQQGLRSYSSSKMVLQAGPSDLPVEMSAYLFIRPLLTNATTNVLWRHIIDKLGYSSHEQPSLRLDRGQAATAKSLVHTLWFQATTQLLSANASPCRLRGRIGDRPFMVVFRGEGATDFGGPFQEFLSGVANEVMGPLAESPDIFLPTFLACLPCLNSTHAIGPHQDSVMLRPDMRGPAPDPLISAAALQQPRLLGEDSSDEGNVLLQGRSGSYADVLQAEEGQGCHELSDTHGCEETRSMFIEGSSAHQFTQLMDRSSSAQPHLGRLLEVNTLWTPNTISSALPSPSRSNPQRSSRPEEPRAPPESTQVDSLGLGASRREGGRSGTPPTSPPSTPPGAGEEPLSEESMQLLMYEALGRLMAMCFCIGTAFNITLNPLVWKKLVAAPLCIDDVADSDCVAVEMIRSLRRMAGVPPQFWDSTMEASLSDMTFSTEDTLGRSFELVEGGADIPVNAFNLGTFIRLSERFRLLEDTSGVEAVLRGIAAVLPLGRMRLLFDWRRLEYRVCGDREVDVATLKERTVCTSERLKSQLFQILESFNNEQMQRFLRFVCGRSRLPVASSDWRMTLDYETSDQRLPVLNDNRLPTAATCSFRLLMPRYSSTAIMRQRLMYAISNCTAIDLDAYVVHEQMQLMYDD